MADPLQPYRDAIQRRVHAVCWNRNLDPSSTVDTEAGCRIERFLPELVALARRVGPDALDTFEAAFEQTICPQCGNLNPAGECPVRRQAECCLYRYLPLVYAAIHSVPPVPHP